MIFHRLNSIRNHMMVIFFILEFILCMILLNVLFFLDIDTLLSVLIFFFLSISTLIIIYIIKKRKSYQLLENIAFTIKYPLRKPLYPQSLKSLCGEVLYLFKDPKTKKMRYVPKQFISFKEGNTLYPYQEIHDTSNDIYEVVKIHNRIALIKDTNDKHYLVHVNQLSVIKKT